MRHPERLFFCVKDVAKFSVKPFDLTEEKDATCAGVVHKVGSKTWEVESPSTWRDAEWLYEKPGVKHYEKTMRTFLRWRMRRYLKEEVELNIRKNVFESALWLFHAEPTFGLAEPKAVEYRERLMRVFADLNAQTPSSMKTIIEHFTKKDDKYVLGMIEAACRGETLFGNDPSLTSVEADENRKQIAEAMQAEGSK